MEITINPLETITVVSLAGDITTNTAPIIQGKVLPLATAGNKILLDMSRVAYMSSAGLRFLLSLYRQTSALEGQLVLVGLSEEITDTMAITGFLNFFTTRDTLESGLTLMQ